MRWLKGLNEMMHMEQLALNKNSPSVNYMSDGDSMRNGQACVIDQSSVDLNFKGSNFWRDDFYTSWRRVKVYPVRKTV